jgi:hypothetical protein
MKKLQLSLDALKVESFTAGRSSEARGTIRARSDESWNETWEGNTCAVWCWTSTCPVVRPTLNADYTCAQHGMCVQPY